MSYRPNIKSVFVLKVICFTVCVMLDVFLLEFFLSLVRRNLCFTVKLLWTSDCLGECEQVEQTTHTKIFKL